MRCEVKYLRGLDGHRTGIEGEEVSATSQRHAPMLLYIPTLDKVPVRKVDIRPLAEWG